MIDTLENAGKSIADLIDISQRQRTFAQLAVFQFPADQPFNILVDSLGRGIFHGSDSSFNTVCHHNDGSFPGTRFGS